MKNININLIRCITMLILVLYSISVSSASIGYVYDQIYVKDEASVNLTDIHNALYTKYGDAFISNKGNGLWYVNKPILADRSTVYITSPEVSELRMSTSANWYLHGTSTGSNGAGFVIENVKIIGWLNPSDIPDNTNSRKIIEIDKSHVSNTSFENLSKVLLYNVYDTSIENITMLNCTGYLEIRNGNNSTVNNLELEHQKGLYTYDLGNFTFSNIKIHNTTYAGDIVFTRTHQSLFHDIIADGIGYPRPVSEGDGGGVNFKQCTYNTGYNFKINDTGWSGFAPGYNYGNWSNITIFNAGHNGIDLHNIKNTVINNVHIYDSTSNNILLTAGYPTSPSTENITITNVYSKNSGIVMQSNVSNIYLANVYQEGDRDGIGISANDITIINATSTSNDAWASINLYGLLGSICNNVTIIDSSVYRLSTQGKNIRILNCKYPSTYYKDKTDYFYTDLHAIGEMGNPVSVGIELHNEIDSSYPSVNGLGKNRTVFKANSMGHTILPNQDRYNSPAIAIGTKKTDESYKAFSHKAIITTPEGRTVSLSNITPDSTWYREDPNIPTYTIIAIIPDSTTGLHITGFAPAEDNPFTEGVTKKFRVWTDQELTTKEWYVDGNMVATGQTEYNWIPSSGAHVIRFVGSNANGEVSQVWNINDDPDVPNIYLPPVEIVSSSPAYTAGTAVAGENTEFSVNTNTELTDSTWYVNGAVVKTGSLSFSKTWDTTGVHTVMFEGSNNESSASRTWTVTVSEVPASKLSITPSSTVVSPGKPFTIDINIDPAVPMNSAQFNVQYASTKAVASGAAAGGMFTGDDVLFNAGTVDNAAGVVKGIYGKKYASTISTPGTAATVAMQAGSDTGMMDLALDNVTITNENAVSLPYTAQAASVLVDTPPELGQLDPRSVAELGTLAFTVPAYDADGNTLTYSAEALPSGASFDTQTGALSWTPQRGQAGTYTVGFSVSDGYLNDSGSMTIEVQQAAPANSLPVITSFKPLDGTTYKEGRTIEIAVQATDADVSQKLTYSIRVDGIEKSNTASYTWVTDYSSAGEHVIEVTVSDGIDRVTAKRNITVQDVRPRSEIPSVNKDKN